MESGFSPLDVSQLVRGYRPSKRRIIFLDYGGTMLPDEKRSIDHFARVSKV
ncbi:unnamed protein product, partial [Discosporangium mesarthrocarpum]